MEDGAPALRAFGKTEQFVRIREKKQGMFQKMLMERYLCFIKLLFLKVINSLHVEGLPKKVILILFLMDTRIEMISGKLGNEIFYK